MVGWSGTLSTDRYGCWVSLATSRCELQLLVSRRRFHGRKVVKVVGLILFMIAMVILGVSCLWVPEKIQMLAMKWVASGPTAKWHALHHFIRSRQYLYNLRAISVLALLSAAFMLWMLTRA
jgi:hypothetical protein